ncbi:hypothetical protein DXG01_005687 [Tephrocybe rancida]|nr:hypothetical protein DXG01_005687 [Tephrocybe rancida]
MHDTQYDGYDYEYKMYEEVPYHGRGGGGRYKAPLARSSPPRQVDTCHPHAYHSSRTPAPPQTPLPRRSRAQEEPAYLQSPSLNFYRAGFDVLNREVNDLQQKLRMLDCQNKVLRSELALLKHGAAPLATTVTRVNPDAVPLTTTVTRPAPAKASRPTTATSHQRAEQLEDGGSDRVKTQGQIFTVFFEFFGTFTKPGFLQRDPPHKSAALWETRLSPDATPQEKADNILAMMIAHTPKDLRLQIGEKDFEVRFLSGFNGIRSQVLRRMRLVAPIVFLLPASYFASKSEYAQELHTLSSFNDDMGSFNLENPIQHPLVLYSMEVRDQGLQEHTKMQLFLGPEMYHFLKAFLFGPSSLNKKGSAGTHPYGQKWGITTMAELPFYVIPLFATLTVFMVSRNEIFHPIGARSGQNYEELYDQLWRYFHIIYEKRKEGSHYEDIMGLCESLVFSKGPKKPTHRDLDFNFSAMGLGGAEKSDDEEDVEDEAEAEGDQEQEQEQEQEQDTFDSYIAEEELFIFPPTAPIGSSPFPHVTSTPPRSRPKTLGFDAGNFAQGSKRPLTLPSNWPPPSAATRQPSACPSLPPASTHAPPPCLPLAPSPPLPPQSHLATRAPAPVQSRGLLASAAAASRPPS